MRQAARFAPGDECDCIVVCPFFGDKIAARGRCAAEQCPYGKWRTFLQLVRKSPRIVTYTGLGWIFVSARGGGYFPLFDDEKGKGVIWQIILIFMSSRATPPH